MKKFLIFLAVTLGTIAALVAVNMDNNVCNQISTNVEAIAEGESGDLADCAGCDNHKSVVCCHLIILGQGGIFLYRD